MVTWLLDSLPLLQPFIRHLLLFLAVKLVGDMVYYRLWPRRREWRSFIQYTWDQLFPWLRFAFVGAVLMRLYQAGFRPGPGLSALSRYTAWLVTGPLPPLAVFISNRWLCEMAAEEARSQERDLTGLP